MVLLTSRTLTEQSYLGLKYFTVFDTALLSALSLIYGLIKIMAPYFYVFHEN